MNDDFNAHYTAVRAELSGLGFDRVREMFRKGIQDSKAYSRYLAETALENFVVHGSNNQLNDHLHDFNTVAKNFMRKAAYVKWCVAHAPLKFEGDKLVKDKVVEATKTKDEWMQLLNQGLSKPYWDFAPEAPMISFTAADLVAALEQTVKKFTGKKYAPKDQVALNELTQAQIKVAELRRLVPIADVIAATPASAAVTGCGTASCAPEPEKVVEQVAAAQAA